jgi:glutamyl-tRNA synthetase
MGITHVIRGEITCPTPPKHVLLYQALGAPLPAFAHIRDPQGPLLGPRAR